MDEMDDKDAALDKGPTDHVLIEKLQAGAISSEDVPQDARLRIATSLKAMGHSASEIGRLLGVGDRQVRRLLEQGRRANAQHYYPTFTAEEVARLRSAAELAVSNIRRSLMDRSVSPRVRIEAERTCWAIERQLFEDYQRAGYISAEIGKRLWIDSCKSKPASRGETNGVGASQGEHPPATVGAKSVDKA